MVNKKKDIWIDSETDLSDNDSNTISSKSVTIKRTTNQMIEQSKNNSCLICSTLSVLSNENCCSKHFALLTKTLPVNIVCNSSELECHCRNHRFLSLSSSVRILLNIKRKRNIK
jgi:hypothetical protein